MSVVESQNNLQNKGNEVSMLNSFLSNKKLLSLGTYITDHPWMCNVYFVVNDNLEFYFLSSPETIHIRQIRENNKVSFTILDFGQLVSNGRSAVQAWGISTQVTELQEVQWFIDKFTKDKGKYNADEISKGIGKVVYKITPQKLKYFDAEKFSQGEHFVWVL